MGVCCAFKHHDRLYLSRKGSTMQQPPFQQPFLPPPPRPPIPVRPPHKPTLWQRYRAAHKRTQWGIGCGIATLIVLLSLCTCGSVGAALGPQRTATLLPTTTTGLLSDTPTSDVQSATPAPTASSTTSNAVETPTVSPNIVPTSTTAPIETPVPTVAPTQRPVPTPVPTQAPVPTVAPTQPPQPTQPPPTGTNGNPWGFNFVTGNLIYSPPSAFCGQYFSCVSTFWTATHGYVVECANGLYSHSGGVRGACSRDGGPSAILYSH